VKAVLLLALCGCAHAELGERHVIETDVGDWVYRRYQKVEDIEFQVPNNAGVGHTAVYQTRETMGRVNVPRTAMAVAFVTEYERADDVKKWLDDKVQELKGYKIKKEKEFWRLAGDGDAWALWASGKYIVKVGVPDGTTPPDELIKAYRQVYP
jgi:hypothetical protein